MPATAHPTPKYVAGYGRRKHPCGFAVNTKRPRLSPRPQKTVSPGGRRCPLEAVADLIRPAALEANQSLVETAEVFLGHLAHGFHRAELALIELLHDLAGFLALFGQADAHAAAVGLRPLVVQVAHVDELLEIVGDVRAEIVAARL